jgi:hypothetical protein
MMVFSFFFVLNVALTPLLRHGLLPLDNATYVGTQGAVSVSVLREAVEGESIIDCLSGPARDHPHAAAALQSIYQD